MVRRGRVHKRVLVRYETVNGSAKKMEHYLPKSDIIVFDSGDELKSIQVEISENSKWTEHQAFFVRLHLEEGDEKTHLGRCANAKIRCQNAVEAPKISFESMNVAVKESEGEVRIPIQRLGNFENQISVKFTTKDETANDGKDYRGGPGTLVFEPNEVLKFVDIEIIDDKEVEKSETFQVNLTECDGAEFGAYRAAIVTIVSDDSTREKIAQIRRYVPLILKSWRPGGRTWREQFLGAVSVNGGDTVNARFSDIVCHVLAFPWKVIFAFVPPPIFLGGWLTFFVALALIGILTAIVGDLAAIFGCLVGLKDVVTSITFVAMGTSLPDTFASRVAILQDPTADNAIGNVTGSNSVNVFLGLGLPWFIAACYWAAKGQSFEVPPGSLGFSVLIYTIVSIACLVLLFFRRRLNFFGAAECGGPALPKYASAVFLVFLWFVYILLSSLQAYGYIPGF